MYIIKCYYRIIFTPGAALHQFTNHTDNLLFAFKLNDRVSCRNCKTVQNNLIGQFLFNYQTNKKKSLFVIIYYSAIKYAHYYCTAMTPSDTQSIRQMHQTNSLSLFLSHVQSNVFNLDSNLFSCSLYNHWVLLSARMSVGHSIFQTLL